MKEYEYYKAISQCSTVSELKVILSSDLLGYKSNTFPKFPIKGFYRARKHNHVEGNIGKEGKLIKFIHEKDFWNPPSEIVQIGRCNNKGISMLYAANRFSTAVFEVKPVIGDYITVASFNGVLLFQREPKLNIHTIGARYLSQIDDLQKPFKNFIYDNGQSKSDNTLDQLFHDISLDGNNSVYKITTAITEIFLTDTFLNNNWQSKTHGLIYSSIVRDKQKFCYVLSPKIAKQFFTLSSLQTFKIIDITNDYIEIEFLREAKFTRDLFYSDYKLIIWKNIYPYKEKIDISEF